jgi:hypothetical protein
MYDVYISNQGFVDAFRAFCYFSVRERRPYIARSVIVDRSILMPILHVGSVALSTILTTQMALRVQK